MVYTESLEIARNKAILISIKYLCICEGAMDQSRSARHRLIRGLTRNGEELARVGFGPSFVKSLIASAKGCGIPASATLFGPLRDWW